MSLQNMSRIPEGDFAAKWTSGVLEGLSNAESEEILRKLGSGVDIYFGEQVQQLLAFTTLFHIGGSLGRGN